jgi:deazaflavin-dependent oxidoreductase (nitroreductase family)
VRAALAHDRTIDITTIGSRSGRPSRVEIWFHNLDGRIYITGSPGRRDWYANLVAHPDFRFQLKRSVRADLPAKARPITDPAERRTVMAEILRRLGGERPLEEWVARSPLVEVELGR